MSTQQLPIDYKAIRVAIVRAVEKATSLKCIVEEPKVQGAPRPDLPYLSMKIIVPGAKFADDHRTNVEGTTKYNIGGQRRMSVSFHSYALEEADAYNFMALLQASLELNGIQEDLRRAGIAVWTIGTVADLTALLNTGYEGRAQMDVQFGLSSNLTEDLGSIETVEIEGTVDTGATVVTMEFDLDTEGD